MKRQYFLLISLLGLALMFILRECSHVREKNNIVAKIFEYSDSVTVLKDGISYNKSLILENEKQLMSVMAENKELRNFKEVKTVTISKTVTLILRDSIPYAIYDTIPCDFNPITVIRDSLHYYFRGTIHQNHFVIDSLSIPNEQTVIVGTRKVGFLKREEVVSISNTNPLISVTGAKSFVIKRKKPWYATTAAKIGAAIVVLSLL
jgi:hypothetical protein